ncbi:methyltransferase [Cytophagales bacterium WSM2-2]|nr:methyltransferase [Cytophagales bacterium WSM2-2]
MSKDLFSGHANLYATFRPTYPKELYEFIFSQLKNFDAAWDAGTGNGQVAKDLAARFSKVLATDISRKQIDNAYGAENISYSIAGETTSFADKTFDLICVAQAAHWFDREKFYTEVKRVAKPGALLAIWGYGLLTVDPDLDLHIKDFYTKVVGPYWDKERKLIDEEYKTITFPFQEIQTPAFSIRYDWSIDELKGYLTTWSSVQKFIKEKNFNPVENLIEKIGPAWSALRQVRFRLFMRVGFVS